MNGLLLHCKSFLPSSSSRIKQLKVSVHLSHPGASLSVMSIQCHSLDRWPPTHHQGTVEDAINGVVEKVHAQLVLKL